MCKLKKIVKKSSYFLYTCVKKNVTIIQKIYMQIKKSAVCEIAGASWRVAAILVSTTTSRSLYLRVVAGCESGCLQSFSILEVCGVACTTPYSLSQRESKVKQPSFFSIVYPRYNLNVIIFKFLQCCKLIHVTYHPILCAKPAFNCSNVLLIRYVLKRYLIV